MPNIIPSNPVNIAVELGNMELYKYHPNGILKVSLDRLIDMLGGNVIITDPSNPFTYLLETNCLNTTFAIQEMTLLTRKLFPRLANTEQDLYMHMSDYDYLGIFSEPAYSDVIYSILLNDFKTHANYNETTKEHVFKIPRHFKLSIDKYIFTLSAAIIIRMTETGLIDIKFENQTYNNIFPLKTTYINFTLYNVNQNETYINFVVNQPEIDIETTELPIEKARLFTDVLTFNPNRKFYFFRAFHMKNGIWTEMLVTHSNEVYDVNTPTCVITVDQGNHTVTYNIPPVYINTSVISSKVKFLIYTTNGYSDVNFGDFPISSFTNEYNPVFPENELDIYTEPLQLISKIVYIKNRVIGGKDNIGFDALKLSVINNSIGDRKLPITHTQEEFLASQNNFRLIPNVDILTNRTFFLESIIPSAITRYPITKINLDIGEYMNTISNMRAINNTIVPVDQFNTIIPVGVIFRYVNGLLELVSTQEMITLNSLSGAELTTEINANVYLYTMYHYILDTQHNETQLRAYDTQTPTIDLVNFKGFNPTSGVGANSTETNITKIDTGYILTVLTTVKSYLASITSNNITPYLVFVDSGGSRFFLQGALITDINGNPVYRFKIDTNFYINASNKLNVTNFRDVNNSVVRLDIDINSKLELIYVSNVIPQNYTPSAIDSYIMNSYIAANQCVVTLEEITINFGKYLKYLYSRVHTSTNNSTYEVYQADVPLRYNSTVYNIDNTILHNVNDIVYAASGSVVNQYKAGDVKLDANGNPIPVNALDLNVYINLALMDYKAQLATKKDIIDYKNYIRDYLTGMITNNAVKLQENLLENTVGYVTVPKNMSITSVKLDNKVVSIQCLQSFSINVYVTSAVYNTPVTRDIISYIIVKEIDTYIANNYILGKTILLDIIYGKLKEYIVSISLTKFTELNSEYIEILDPRHRIGLDKTLVLDTDGYSLKENVDIFFLMV